MAEDNNQKGSEGSGCLIIMLVGFVAALFGTASWLCHIENGVEYTWYSGIWQGLFVVENWIMNLFNSSVLYKATNYTPGYNVWYWITSICSAGTFIIITLLLILSSLRKQEPDNQ